jgi:hypothetical protein
LTQLVDERPDLSSAVSIDACGDDAQLHRDLPVLVQRLTDQRRRLTVRGADPVLPLPGRISDEFQERERAAREREPVEDP